MLLNRLEFLVLPVNLQQAAFPANTTLTANVSRISIRARFVTFVTLSGLVLKLLMLPHPISLLMANVLTLLFLLELALA
jgi:hypothetical protein